MNLSLPSFKYTENTFNPFIVECFDDKGFGLKAISLISEGQLIVENPARKIPKGSNVGFSMAQFLFVDPTSYKDNQKRDLIMVCGPMTFLNHSSEPNCRVKWKVETNGLLLATLYAASDILPDDELTIKYTDERDYRNEGLFA
ncbi:SET domain-containing protein [Amylibacter sp. SFDW26]|uniref:SET domain-containing protein-lysine N-methyltransferase n=1 Tax=Amylibacter sp. SFDW26 TaxID=2652722 RepID=UPI001262317B|nr:SET domain-containing protein-lysine N-methyltransferase [Amylibacter sp. SFDW26]KAB7613753.1 SET domain-containing protein [Amylibacter sp. SFDW26]